MKENNWKTTIILAVTLSAIFVVTRYFMGDYYTPEWSARNIFWVVALIVLLTCYFDKLRFSLSAFAGYIIGMVAGDLFGGFQKNVPPQYLHFGWLIQIVIFLLFCLFGIVLQHRHRG